MFFKQPCMTRIAISYLKIVALALVLGVGLTSCKPMSNAQRATKIAKKRYKHIKHDCNCHSYLYKMEEHSEIEG